MLSRARFASLFLLLEAYEKPQRLAKPEEERGDYLAQREVPHLLLGPADKKLTLRIYVLLLADHNPGEPDSDDSDDQTVKVKAYARRKFVCRIHPRTYDKQETWSQLYALCRRALRCP